MKTYVRWATEVVAVGKVFSLLHVVQTGSRAHLTSYPMGTGASFLEGKASGA
jgi:hypothetical protein